MAIDSYLSLSPRLAGVVKARGRTRGAGRRMGGTGWICGGRARVRIGESWGFGGAGDAKGVVFTDDRRAMAMVVLEGRVKILGTPET